MSSTAIYPLAPNFRIEIGLPWEPPNALRDRIDAIWRQELELRGDSLTDGRIYCLADFATDRLVIRPSRYRYVLARRREPGLAALGLDLRPVAVTGILTCRDGLVLGRRGSIVAADAGRWEPAPAGGLSQPDAAAQVMDELREELGIAASQVSAPAACALVEDGASGVMDIVFRLETALTGPEVQAAYRSGGSAEYADLAVVTRAALPQFLRVNADQLLPALVPMLRAAGLV